MIKYATSWNVALFKNLLNCHTMAKQIINPMKNPCAKYITSSLNR